MPLSDIKIRNLKSTDKAYKVSDFEGLFILVKVSGAKSWRFKYRLDGKERLWGLAIIQLLFLHSGQSRRLFQRCRLLSTESSRRRTRRPLRTGWRRGEIDKLMH